MTIGPIAALTTLSLLLLGCAQPVLEIAEPGDEVRTAAATMLENAEPTPARLTPEREMWPALYNIVAPTIRASALETCAAIELPEERCRAVANANVVLHAGSSEINAYADQQNYIGVHGGLISNVGNDAELAAVVAHEYAHVMLGHVEKKVQNALIGAAIAGGLAALAQHQAQTYDQTATENAMMVGAMIGSRAYSPEMEIEADRMAVYILDNAGWNKAAMADVIVRLHGINTGGGGAVGFFPAKVSFLETHPSDDRRMAHILSAIEDAEADEPLTIAVHEQNSAPNDTEECSLYSANPQGRC